MLRVLRVAVCLMSCRYFSDITLYGLEVLQLVTLSPLPRRAIVAASSGSSGSSSGRGGQAGSSRSGMATLLHAASTGNTQPFYGLADPEVCVCVSCACFLCFLCIEEQKVYLRCMGHTVFVSEQDFGGC